MSYTTILKRYWFVLVLGGIFGAWFCRGMELAWWQTSAATATLAQTGAKGAAPQVQPMPDPSATCQTAEPPTASSYLAVAHADALQVGINPLVFDWQIWVESQYDPNAHSGA